jgi:hypothetical protein
MMNDESELRELIKDHKHVCTECKVEFTIIWASPVPSFVGKSIYCPACGKLNGVSYDEKN